MSLLSKREAAAILGVWEDARERDIKLAYRKLAIKWHPGTSIGSRFAPIPLLLYHLTHVLYNR